ncbi:hypothetical protein M8494_10415 [Serratia ureilytica]
MTANLVLNALGSVRLFDGSETTPDRHLVTLPLFHTFGSTVQMNAGFASRRHSGAGRALRRRAGHRADATARHHLFRRVPTMLWALLNALDEHTDIESLRNFAAYGGVRRRQPAGADLEDFRAASASTFSKF